MSMELVFGGTFDPFHAAHEQVCLEAAAQLGATSVRLIPSARPPHRNPSIASATQRLDMLRLAIAPHKTWQADHREILRDKPSYTIDTLKELRAELGFAHSLVVLIGADQFVQLHRWYQWHGLFDYAHIAVMNRPGSSLENPIVEAILRSKNLPNVWSTPSDLVSSAFGKLCLLPVSQLAISASEIRRRLQAGVSVDALLAPVVLQYIRANHLYAAGPQ
jgi:nicotinate-nucleotide adenylyltransferase